MQPTNTGRSAMSTMGRELAGKTAIVTGSTSGIGLGIARAFAAAGMNIVLNGFGDKNEVEAIRTELAKSYDVKIAYSAADMSKPDEITAMVADALATAAFALGPTAGLTFLESHDVEALLVTPSLERFTTRGWPVD